MIQLRNLSFDLNVTQIFENISCTFDNNDHVGIVGRNGAGKSTLIKIIAGRLLPTSGSVNVSKDTRIGYLPQEEVLSSNLVVFDEAFSAFQHIVETEERLQYIENLLVEGECDEVLLEEYAALCIKAKTYNRHDAIKETEEVLTGLGFSAETIQKKVNELSTGWKMRLALAKLLLTDAEMYLFDEPTNHLDIVTQEWFLKKLQLMKQGFLLISHDQAYLEKACTSILEIERGRGTHYHGNLQSYLQEKEAALEIARVTRARQDREIEKKQEVVDRFRAGTRSQQAKNISRQIERIELVEIDSPMPTINFRFPAPSQPGSSVLKFNNLSYTFNEKLLFKGISGEIQRGERVALVAANGVGKTTLINCLMGKYKPLGSVEYGYAVQTAFFEQEQASSMDPEKTVFEEVVGDCLKISEADARMTLGAFQFSGDTVKKKIKVLSGGEKNRLAMAKILLQKANFLILDEPTNHLDLYSKDILRQALASYQGTILFVSHDLNFVNRLATRIIELTPTTAHGYPGNYDDFCAIKTMQSDSTQFSARKDQFIKKSVTKSSVSLHSEEQLSSMKKKLKNLENDINLLEYEEKQKIKSLENTTYESVDYMKTNKQIEIIRKQLKQAELDWQDIYSSIS